MTDERLGLAEPRVIRVQSAHGPFWTYDDDLITQQLQVFGAHTRNELAMVLDQIREGDRVVDMGAHIGTFTVPIARRVGPRGRVLAVEASSATFRLLVRNLGAQGLCDRVQCQRAVLGSDAVPALMRAEVTGNTGAGHFLPDPSGESRCIDVRRLISRCGFARPDFIKIDVEGMEPFILRSLVPLLQTSRPKLYLEVAEEQLARFGATRDEIEELLRGLGYRFFRNQGPRNSTQDAYHQVELERLADGGSFFDLLALPAGRLSGEWSPSSG